jgi:hypothetical protein
MQRLLASEGYIVQGSSEQMRSGSSVRMWGSDDAFRILGAASYQDALRQWHVYEEIRGEKMEPPPPPSTNWHYFKFGAASKS